MINKLEPLNLEDLYHQLCNEYGKAKVWYLNNDEVCNLCEEFIKQRIISAIKWQIKEDEKVFNDFADKKINFFTLVQRIANNRNLAFRNNKDVIRDD